MVDLLYCRQMIGFTYPCCWHSAMALAQEIFLVVFIIIFLFCVFIKLTTSPFPVIETSEQEKVFRTGSGAGAELKEFPSLSDPSTLSLSVIVPAYNEELRLPAMLGVVKSYRWLRATVCHILKALRLIILAVM